MTMDETHAVARTVVLVTNQFQCERLIHAGKTLADVTGTELCILSVQSSRYPPNPLALEHLFNISKQNGGDMNVTYGEDPAHQIIHFIKHHKTLHVVSGIPQDENSMLYTVWKKFTHIRFFTVDGQGVTSEITRADVPFGSRAAFA
ncbi:MAG: hypothetical protein HFG26_06285 [Provencibacterium sp.]|jgi:K+-sensing histidine kinase KdpD|nr:hypothetical protein [Provencibacterium sp.]